MGILDSAIGIGSSLLGAWGTQQTNDMNLAIAQNNSAFNAAQAEANRQFTAGQAERQMQFQESMSSSAYQRATKDMEAAGLNPMLAYSQGGASSPGGASGSGSTASAVSPPAMQNKWAGGMSSAVEVSRAAADIAVREREAKLRDQEIEINKPKVKAAGAVEKGIDTVQGGVKAAGEKVSEVVQAVEDMLKGGKVSTVIGDTVEKVKDVAKQIGIKLDDVLGNPSKFISGATSSAGHAVQRAKDALESARNTPAPQWSKDVKAGSFSGDFRKDSRDLNSIQNDAERAAAWRSYYMWRAQQRQ